MKWKICILVALLLSLPLAAAINVEFVTSDPAPIVAGEYADVTLRFTKSTADAETRDARFLIEETPVIMPISEQELTLSRFRPGDVVTHTFRLYFAETLPQGYIDIPANIIDGGRTQNADVRVFVEEAERAPELLIGAVESVPNELLPDTDDNTLHLTVQNLGDKDAELVRAELVPVDVGIAPAYTFSLVDSVATIPAGSEEEFAFTVDVKESARGAIPMRLDLRYRAERSSGTSYETFEHSIPFRLPITDAPFLTVVNVTYLDAFEAGTTENRARVTLRNDGPEDAEEVRVRALPDISYPFIFELTTEYVASRIRPGETAQVEFTVEVLDDAEAREYPVTLRLESLIGETRYTREDTMELVARRGNELDPRTVGIGILAIAAVASAWLGIVMWRKRRHKRRKR